MCKPALDQCEKAVFCKTFKNYLSGFFPLRGLNSNTYFFPWSARLLVSSQHIFINLFSRCNKCYIKCKTELANCLCCLYGFPEWADIKCFLKMLFLSNLLQLSDIHALAFLQSADDCDNATADFCLAFVDSTELPSPLVIGQRVWCTTQRSSEKMMWAF